MSKNSGGRGDSSRNPANPENKSRNEYIPHFISQKPFYIPDGASESDYLGHQRLDSTTAPAPSKWYDRGKKLPAATKYRKGACENCGALTHKAKDCLDRPRKAGAKWTGKDIRPDEVIEDVELTWDGKRDRWNGYDAREHKKVIEEYERLEQLRRQKEGEDAEDDGGDKYAEEAAAPGQGFDSAARISTRNLRIREDTAKYLLNLDLDSAKYDPKTRTMVDKGATSDKAAALVEEEEFIRSSGDAEAFERLQRAAWETQERGDKTRLHLQANPTEAEVLRKRMEKEKAEAAEKKRRELLEKYGGAEYLKKAPVVEEKEAYVEYTPTGEIKGAVKPKRKSMYVEDVYPGNHTSVWGSWWENFRWGYACCHSTTKNSYCTGEAGIKAAEEAKAMRLGLVQPKERHAIEEKKEEEPAPVEEERREREREGEEKKGGKGAGLSAKAGGDRGADENEGKRKVELMLGGVTEEDMEEYRKAKRIHDDPMANFVDNGDI